ncbi:MAG: hypothetical protein ACTSVM_05335 [Candidatus Ranarchaeia archaeon]
MSDNPALRAISATWQIIGRPPQSNKSLGHAIRAERPAARITTPTLLNRSSRLAIKTPAYREHGKPEKHQLKYVIAGTRLPGTRPHKKG